jgi:hypothetical protein
MEAAQMRFLRPLLGLTRLDRQRNREKPLFESGQHSGGHQTVSKEMGRPPGTNG